MLTVCAKHVVFSFVFRLQALDERSLRLTLDEQGTIIAVGNSVTALFGFNAHMLVGQNVSACVLALQGQGESGDGWLHVVIDGHGVENVQPGQIL